MNDLIHTIDSKLSEVGTYQTICGRKLEKYTVREGYSFVWRDAVFADNRTIAVDAYVNDEVLEHEKDLITCQYCLERTNIYEDPHIQY